MMKRALLRLKGGKGGVLFFIIAIMTVMIVLASAVYYSTISARAQVEIKYGKYVTICRVFFHRTDRT